MPEREALPRRDRRRAEGQNRGQDDKDMTAGTDDGTTHTRDAPRLADFAAAWRLTIWNCGRALSIMIFEVAQ
jgi:hypothetical protein